MSVDAEMVPHFSNAIDLLIRFHFLYKFYLEVYVVKLTHEFLQFFFMSPDNAGNSCIIFTTSSVCLVLISLHTHTHFANDL